MDQELTEEELQDLYAWIDKIPLSRPKRHITRDFSDGGRKLKLPAWLRRSEASSWRRTVSICNAIASWMFGSNTLWVCALCCDLTASLLPFSHGCRGREAFPAKAGWPPQLHSCQLDPAKAQQLERPQQARQQSFSFDFGFFFQVFFFPSDSMKCEGSRGTRGSWKRRHSQSVQNKPALQFWNPDLQNMSILLHSKLTNNKMT